MFRGALETGFAFAKLASQLVHDFVNGSVEVGFGIFGVDVGAWEAKVDFDSVRFLFGFVVEKDDMSTENARGHILKGGDFLRDVSMDGCREGEVSRAEMDLHCFWSKK